jgi:Fic family protein
MQRPPNRSAPNILFARGTSEWIRRLNEKHKQLASVKQSSEQKNRLEKWTEIEFIYATLALEGIVSDREQISRLLDSETEAGVNAGDAAALAASLRKVTALARARAKNAELTNDLLLEIHSVPGAGFRKTLGITSGPMKPPPPHNLSAILESAFQWYTADSFTELNPIEQAALVLLRLIEIQPFEEKNERTALVAASLFTLRSDLPPLIVKSEMTAGYRVALDEATRMNTKPMVELLASAIEETLDASIQQLSRRE